MLLRTDLTRSPRTGVLPGYEDLADPDTYRVAAYAIVLAGRLAVLRDFPGADRFPDTAGWLATLTSAHLRTSRVAASVGEFDRITIGHLASLREVVSLMARAQHHAGGVLRFGHGVDLVDAETLFRIARAVFRRVCAAGADQAGMCHRLPGRVRLRVTHPDRSHTDYEPGCIVHTGNDLHTLTHTGGNPEVLIIGPARIADQVRDYARQLQAGVIRAAHRTGTARSSR